MGSQTATFFHLFWSNLAALPRQEVGVYGPQWPVSDYIVRAMSSPIGDDACAGSGTSDGNKAATCAAFARAALNTASDTVTGFPDEVSCPRWGQVGDCIVCRAICLTICSDSLPPSPPLLLQDTHQAKFTHQVLSHSPLACLADRQVEHGGDESTVNVGGKRLFRETSELRVKTVFQTEGPSYRCEVSS